MTDPMDIALSEARAAALRGEVPVGAALIGPDGALVAADGNRTEAAGDPTAHAEYLVLRQAAATLGLQRLTGCDLHVTLEPCAFCAAAIALFRVRRVYFGAYDAKGGAVEHGPRLFEQKTILWHPEVYGGIRETECAALLTDFFRGLRESG